MQTVPESKPIATASSVITEIESKSSSGTLTPADTSSPPRAKTSEPELVNRKLRDEHVSSDTPPAQEKSGHSTPDRIAAQEKLDHGTPDRPAKEKSGRFTPDRPAQEKNDRSTLDILDQEKPEIRLTPDRPAEDKPSLFTPVRPAEEKNDRSTPDRLAQEKPSHFSPVTPAQEKSDRSTPDRLAQEKPDHFSPFRPVQENNDRSTPDRLATQEKADRLTPVRSVELDPGNKRLDSPKKEGSPRVYTERPELLASPKRDGPFSDTSCKEKIPARALPITNSEEMISNVPSLKQKPAIVTEAHLNIGEQQGLDKTSDKLELTNDNSSINKTTALKTESHKEPESTSKSDDDVTSKMPNNVHPSPTSQPTSKVPVIKSVSF